MLLPRPKLGLVQREIVDGADAQDADSRQTLRDAVHKGAARATEVVGHGLARVYRLRLAVRLEAVLSAHVLEVRVLYGEVAGKHGCCDLATVGTVADERPDETLALNWLFAEAHVSPAIDTHNGA